MAIVVLKLWFEMLFFWKNAKYRKKMAWII